MGIKATFDPVNHEIVIIAVPIGGIVTIDFKVDIYSDGKEDWITNSALARHTFPLRAVGGDPLPGALALDPTFFILPPWKILPYDSDHQLIMQGNVYREDGESIFISRPGRTIVATLQTTFSAGVSGGGGGGLTTGQVANAVWGDGRALTLGKFVALK